MKPLSIPPRVNLTPRLAHPEEMGSGPTGGSNSVFYEGRLSCHVGHLDQALYVASCFAVVPQIIYSTCDEAWADPATGEAYLILDETTEAPGEPWEPIYLIRRPF